MMGTTFAPAMHSSAGTQGSVDTRMELVARVRAASNRVAVRVLIANHQPIVRHGLRSVIDSEPDLQVIAEADDGSEAVRIARQLRPDVVLIDLSMPTVDGISATRMIRAELRGTHVIVMTGVHEDASAIEAIRAGAAAYLLKGARIDDLLRTIRGAGAGQVALPAQTVARMVRLVGGHEVLSQRETDVLYLVARGLANKQVARELGITESTVKTHVSGILSKLGLPSRTQIALYAARTGLVALDHLGSDTALHETDDTWVNRNRSPIGRFASSNGSGYADPHAEARPYRREPLAGRQP
jgi:two-component system, NarL family, response regulator LiaR